MPPGKECTVQSTFQQDEINIVLTIASFETSASSIFRVRLPKLLARSPSPGSVDHPTRTNISRRVIIVSY